MTGSKNARRGTKKGKAMQDKEYWSARPQPIRTSGKKSKAATHRIERKTFPGGGCRWCGAIGLHSFMDCIANEAKRGN